MHCIFSNAMDPMDLFDPSDITNSSMPTVYTDYIDWPAIERASTPAVFPDVIVARSEAANEIESSISFEPQQIIVPVDLLAPDTAIKLPDHFSCHLCLYQTLPTAKSPINSMHMHMIRQHRGYHYECKECLEDKQTHENFQSFNRFIQHMQNEHRYMVNHGISSSALQAYLYQHPNLLKSLLPPTSQNHVRQPLYCPRCHKDGVFKKWKDISGFVRHHTMKHERFPCPQCHVIPPTLRAWALHCLNKTHLFQDRDYNQCLVCRQPIIINRHGTYSHLNHLLQHPTCFNAILDDSYQ